MLLTILACSIGFAAKTVVLLAALWIMIRLQSLDYSFLGLLGSAALASGLDMIPYFGHYLAVPVLYVCIALITRADLFPDAVFTVVIAYALMFCLNMFLLAGLLGDLRPSVTVQASKSGDTSLVAGQEMDEKAATTPERPVKADAAMKDAPKPNALAAAQAVPGPKSAESGSATNEVAQKLSL